MHDRGVAVIAGAGPTLSGPINHYKWPTSVPDPAIIVYTSVHELELYIAAAEHIAN